MPSSPSCGRSSSSNKPTSLGGGGDAVPTCSLVVVVVDVDPRMECNRNAGTNATCRGKTAYTVVAVHAKSSTCSNNAELKLFMVYTEEGIVVVISSSCCDKKSTNRNENDDDCAGLSCLGPEMGVNENEAEV
jgi:hypothetical protein